MGVEIIDGMGVEIIDNVMVGFSEASKSFARPRLEKTHIKKTA
jgi:hypothetical protein